MEMEQLSMDNLYMTDVQRLENAIRAELRYDEVYLAHITVTENKHTITVKSRTMVAARVSSKKDGSLHLEFKARYLPKFSGTQVQKAKDGGRIVLRSFEEVLAFVPQIAAMAVEELAGQGDSFACCSRFTACSDAGHCLHPDKLTALSCSYRKNLEKGRIFYGENKNI